MRCKQEPDNAIYDPIAKPFAVISAAIAGFIMIPILIFAPFFKGKDDEDIP